MVPAREPEKTHRSVSGALLSWWDSHGRSYPWRRTRDPYRILIAEILLHRTRADQVKRVYEDFIRRYPTVADLARAKRADVIATLKPLGLRWRSRLLLAMARVLHEQYQDEIPRSSDLLKSLPGVGDYIAAAVQCFAFGVPTPILDANTVRVTGRIFGVPISDSARRKEEFRNMYSSLHDVSRSRDFNLAMIDLAALLCRPSHPRCHLCPISTHCEFGRGRNEA